MCPNAAQSELNTDTVDQNTLHGAQVERNEQLLLQPLPPPPHAQIMTHFHPLTALAFG